MMFNGQSNLCDPWHQTSASDCSLRYGRYKNSLPLPTKFSQKLPQPSEGIIYPVGDFADVSQNKLGPLPIHYIVIRYPQQMVQMAFVTCRIHFTNRLPMFHQHVFVILLWGIWMSPLTQIQGSKSMISFEYFMVYVLHVLNFRPDRTSKEEEKPESGALYI